MTQPNNKIREEWEEEFDKKFDSSSCFCGCYEGDLEDRFPDTTKELKLFISELLKSQELNYKINCSKHGHITPKPVCPKCYNKTLAELDVLIYDKSKRK